MELTLTTATGHVYLELPGNEKLLMAAGCVALAHGQLELMLRMVVKTLMGFSIREALDATRADTNGELRKKIRKLISKKTKDVDLMTKADALLGGCRRLSDRRNELLHNSWAIGQDGSVLAKGANHAWGTAPSA